MVRYADVTESAGVYWEMKWDNELRDGRLKTYGEISKQQEDMARMRKWGGKGDLVTEI